VDSERIVAIVVAQIYGRRFSLDPLFSVLHSARFRSEFGDIAVIEDAAEAFSGFAYLGDPRADLAFFSFGSIKIHTALGGGVAVFRSETDYRCVREYEARRWPAQRDREFFKKCMKSTLTMSLLNVPFVSSSTMRAAHALRIDHKDYVVAMLRGFPGAAMLAGIRHRPSPALLRFLEARLTDFDQEGYERGNCQAELAVRLLQITHRDGSLPRVSIPGDLAPVRNHWLFPIVVPQPERTIALLNAHGVDAYRGATQLALVEPPTLGSSAASAAPTVVDSKGDPFVPSVANARSLMAHVIYLPVHKRVPDESIVRMCAVVRRVLLLLQQQNKSGAMASATTTSNSSNTRSSESGCQGQTSLQLQLPSKL
jgi:dTDP-4-amino-4,6-dideoxygalactose transaminase